NLCMQEFYIKMTIDGEAFDPFSAETLSVIKPDHESYKKQIIELSRKKYAVQLEEFKKIEEEKARKEKEEENLIKEEVKSDSEKEILVSLGKESGKKEKQENEDAGDPLI
ncbi:MAG: hypothetical protein AAB593_02265, partial [Patescibacteria group bacterium]